MNADPPIHSVAEARAKACNRANPVKHRPSKGQHRADCGLGRNGRGFGPTRACPVPQLDAPRRRGRHASVQPGDQRRQELAQHRRPFGVLGAAGGMAEIAVELEIARLDAPPPPRPVKLSAAPASARRRPSQAFLNKGMSRVGPGHVTLSSAPRKLEPPVLPQPSPAPASPPVAVNSDTGVPNFLMALLRRNRR